MNVSLEQVMAVASPVVTMAVAVWRMAVHHTETKHTLAKILEQQEATWALLAEVEHFVGMRVKSRNDPVVHRGVSK